LPERILPAKQILSANQFIALKAHHVERLFGSNRLFCSNKPGIKSIPGVKNSLRFFHRQAEEQLQEQTGTAYSQYPPLYGKKHE